MKKTTGKSAAEKSRRKTAPKSAPKKRVTRKVATKKAATRKKSVAKKAASRKKAGATHKAATKKRSASKKTTVQKAVSHKTAGAKKAVTPKPAAQKKTTSRRKRAHATIGGIPPYKRARGEPYMNESQREHFARLLDAWKQELMEEVDRTVHHMQDEASNFPDPNDRASQESEFSLELRTRDRERKLLRKIDHTIADLEMNEYGWCEACGAEIGIRRLEARPTATLCIDCKTLDELRERQTGT
ncbi:MAG: RNA polymerase-binding protein DksA [Gammaproteobacteria bacterium]